MGRFVSLSLGLLVVAFSLNGVRGGRFCDWFPVNGICYKVFTTPKTWLDAEVYCMKLKAECHLASIHRHEDSVELAKYMSSELTDQGHVWIGLQDRSKNYTWEWTDGSRAKYLPWRENQPDHYEDKEFCVQINGFTEYLLWNDYDCSALRPFLCQCKS